MSKIIRFLLLSALLGASGTSFALDESQAEDMADLTAVFIYLKMIVVIRISPIHRSATPLFFRPPESLGLKQL